MNDFELNAINDRHITELQAESQNMALARSLSGEPPIQTASRRFVRRAGAAVGRAVRVMHVPGVPSRHEPA